MQPGGLLLAIDTCGPAGSVALGRLPGRDLEILGQTELEGRSYAATLVAAVAELLERNHVTLKDLGGIVAVNGPGSFTGVRVGLSAVKGLAEPAQIPVVAISRLLVLQHSRRSAQRDRLDRCGARVVGERRRVGAHRLCLQRFGSGCGLPGERRTFGGSQQFALRRGRSDRAAASRAESRGIDHDLARRLFHRSR